MISTALYYIQNKLETLTGYNCYIELNEDDDLPVEFLLITQNQGDTITATGDCCSIELSVDIFAQNILNIDTVFDQIMAANFYGESYTKGSDTIFVNSFLNRTGFIRKGVAKANDRNYIVYRIDFYIDYTN